MRNLVILGLALSLSQSAFAGKYCGNVDRVRIIGQAAASVEPFDASGGIGITNSSDGKHYFIGTTEQSMLNTALSVMNRKDLNTCITTDDHGGVLSIDSLPKNW